MVLSTELALLAGQLGASLAHYAAIRVDRTVRQLAERSRARSWGGYLSDQSVRIVQQEQERLRRLAHELPLTADVRTPAQKLRDSAWASLTELLTPADILRQGWDAVVGSISGFVRLTLVLVILCWWIFGQSIGWYAAYAMGALGLFLIGTALQRALLALLALLGLVWYLAGFWAAAFIVLLFIVLPCLSALPIDASSPQYQLRVLLAEAKQRIDNLCAHVLEAQKQEARRTRRGPFLRR